MTVSASWTRSLPAVRRQSVSLLLTFTAGFTVSSVVWGSAVVPSVSRSQAAAEAMKQSSLELRAEIAALRSEVERRDAADRPRPARHLVD